ncbi:MAG: metal-dependent transcriptional regulator [Deltaproteobacteria bacterium]|nr:metal-dependent transcriptional regulator [Deltaproteobacteria bacterium]
MQEKKFITGLSESQEKYLRTIYMLELSGEVAKVKDIARIREVKPGSVSPAMRNLAKLGLIHYVRREFIQLTPKGIETAHKVESKIGILNTFFSKTLKLSEKDALQQTCAVEHSLSEEAILGIAQIVKSLMSKNDKILPESDNDSQIDDSSNISISMMPEGEDGTISLIKATGDLSDQIMNMGLLPDSKIHKKKRLKNGCVIAIGGYEIILNEEQASAVEVVL